ncbi:MAG: hypothetical protein WCG98_10820 [bacterium]
MRVGNFLGSIKGKNPEIIGITTEEINKLSTLHSPQGGLQSSTPI